MIFHGRFQPGLFYDSVFANYIVFTGDLTSLTALNLRHCLLEFPPKDIIQKGLKSILCFLQDSGNGKLLSMEPAVLGMLGIYLCAFTIICFEKSVKQGMLSLWALSLMGVVELCI